MKRCSRCKKWKDESEFNIRNVKGVKLQYVCKLCQRDQGRERYQKHTERVKEINNRARIKSKKIAIEFIQEYLHQHPCADCGETDIVVLTFDHVRGEKRDNVSVMIQDGYSINTLKDEIEKTDVVCFNCHMRREQKRNNSWRSSLISSK